MITNEQIAHDLTIIYLSNLYGMDITGDFHISNGLGSGKIKTEHFPDTKAWKYKEIKTGQKGFLGIEKKIKVESGYEVDDLFIDILKNYRKAYNHFLELLENSEI